MFDISALSTVSFVWVKFTIEDFSGRWENARWETYYKHDKRPVFKPRKIPKFTSKTDTFKGILTLKIIISHLSDKFFLKKSFQVWQYLKFFNKIIFQSH